MMILVMMIMMIYDITNIQFIQFQVNDGEYEYYCVLVICRSIVW
jgi:hypothetical protein